MEGELPQGTPAGQTNTGGGGDVLGAVVSGGFGLVAGHQNRKEARAAAQRNEALQKEFAQHSVRWRVEDAKRAGLHPLYAMGGNLAAGSPVAVGDTSGGEAVARMGQDIGRAVAAQETLDQRQQRNAALGLIAAQTRESDARAHLAYSQAARLSQPDQVGPGMPAAIPEPRLVGQPGAVRPALIREKASEQESAAPGLPHLGAAIPPGWKRYTIGTPAGGEKVVEVIAPVNEEGWTEGLESMPIWMYPRFVRENARYLGMSNAEFIRGLVFNMHNKPSEGPLTTAARKFYRWATSPSNRWR